LDRIAIKIYAGIAPGAHVRTGFSRIRRPQENVAACRAPAHRGPHHRRTRHDAVAARKKSKSLAWPGRADNTTEPFLRSRQLPV